MSRESVQPYNRRILERTAWRPRLADLDGIVRDALGWERHLATRNAE